MPIKLPFCLAGSYLLMYSSPHRCLCSQAQTLDHEALHVQVPVEIPLSWTAASLGLMVINMIWLFKLLRYAFERPRLRKKEKGKLS